MRLIFEKGSYRDPAGKIFYLDGKVLRGLSEEGLKRYKHIKSTKVLEESISKGFLIDTKELIENIPLNELKNFDLILEHKKVPFISYPYEWCFQQLKDAALHHLDFQIYLLEKNCVLIDASAYNIQFINSKPIFIDVLSIEEYKEGSYWYGHQQFCENFFNPLLLSSKKNVEFNSWFRGNLEGIPTSDLNSILSFKDKFSLSVFMHVHLLDKLKKKTIADPKKTFNKIEKNKSISKNSYISILSQLRKAIAKLEQRKKNTTWGTYSSQNTYSDNEELNKLKIVSEFSKKNNFKYLVDLGCNDGAYSFESIKSGSKNVIGVDFDLKALNRAFNYSKSKGLNFQAVYMDASNPSPNQGWNEKERTNILSRIKFDGMIAMAFEHHLAIAKNVPLSGVVNWLINFAPKGLIEFIPKKDQTIQSMLQLKNDIFPNYNEENFVSYLEAKTKIISKKQVSSSGRIVYEYSHI